MRVAPTYTIEHSGPKDATIKASKKPAMAVVETEAAGTRQTKHCPPKKFSTGFVYAGVDAGVTGHMFYDFSDHHNVKARFDEQIKLVDNSTMRGTLYHLNGTNYWVQSGKCQVLKDVYVPVDCFMANSSETTLANNEVVHVYRTYFSHKNVTGKAPLATFIIDNLNHPLMHLNMTQTWDMHGKFTGTATSILYFNSTNLAPAKEFMLPAICPVAHVSDELPENFEKTFASKYFVKQ
jgi:hypothetical protein